ncbi:TMBIM4 [Cordylochernes scorpioides]|uniref:TMBIM4 n=1 Tax=Cordylochernes scorpioides TaxID=51811 RepID=A0ABY6L4X0_9ARAC|nr:TMBIM4 [Cordylochernes scorpioides]
MDCCFPAFLRKVYGILSFQILLTILVTSVAMFSPIVRFFINENQWMVGVSFLLALGLLFGLMVKGREFPTNYILLALFEKCGELANRQCDAATYYDQMVVLQAFLLTLTVTVGLTVYTFQTRRDFSSWKSG